MEFWPGAFPIWFRRRIPGTFGSQPSSAYSPLQESGIMFWYDFSNLALSDNDPITTLTDKSGNGRTLTFDATKQPLYKVNILNSLAGALFDNTNDNGYTSAFAWGSNECTVFAIVSGIANTGDRCIVEFGNASTENGCWLLYRQNTNTTLVGLLRDNAVFANSTSATTGLHTGAYMFSTLQDHDPTNKVRLWINGIEEGNHGNGAVGTADFATKALYVGSRANGASMPLNGYIHEVFGYKAALDADAIGRVHNYLISKWAPSGFNFGVGDFADNAYTVSASQTSPAARVVINTDADYAVIDVTNTIGALSGLGDCGARLNGSDLASMENVATGTEKHSLYLGTKGTTRKLELLNGIQSMSGTTRLGSWIAGAFFNGSAVVASSSEPTTPRIMVYGDSIAGGQAAANPSLQGWVQLLRNTYSVTGSVVLEGWGNRKLKDDCPDTADAQAFVEHIANNITPTIIWLAIGHNDLGAWTAAEFETAYGDFLDRLHTELPSAAIYAQTPIISNPDGVQGTFRTAIGNAQSTRAAFVTLVDGTAAAFPQVGDLAVDGVHPTTAGQAKHHAAAVAILGI